MDPVTQALHWSLLRLAKGMLRAWETWLRAKTGSHSLTITPRPDSPAPDPS